MPAFIAQYDSAQTSIYFNEKTSALTDLVKPNICFFITDEHVAKHYESYLAPHNKFVIIPGENSKNIKTIEKIIEQLLALNADKTITIIGMGGGVITDIAGFVGGIYKRGVMFGFIPTSILGMVDAAIGGKNGVNVANYKNMIGLISQPQFILYDYELLATLPQEEWTSGFAEIIKHACILDKDMFLSLQKNTLQDFQNNTLLIQELIERNVKIKYNIVSQDPTEKGIRKLLNFGHTFGHAIEKLYSLPHGYAVALGMIIACKLSEHYLGFKDTHKVVSLLQQYHLPISFRYNSDEVIQLMLADKKAHQHQIDFILLKEIGQAVIYPIQIEELIALFNNNSWLCT